MVKKITYAVVFFILMFPYNSFANKVNADNRAEYTLMIYMDGSNLESKAYKATLAITEIIKADTGKNANILLKTGGAKFWLNKNIKADKSQIYLIKNHTMTTLQEEDMENMGEAKTLSDFLQYGINHYPADKYGLIFWGHGFGNIKGFGYDENFDHDGLDIMEIKKALGLVNMKFEFIGFDACFMSTIELAYVLSDYTDYMIASEGFSPASGWNYNKWLPELSKEIDTVKLCSDIVEQYGIKHHDNPFLLTLIDFKNIQLLDEYITELSKDLMKLCDNHFQSILDMRAELQDSEKNDLKRIDSVDLLELYDTVEKRENMVAAYENSILKRSLNNSKRKGLSIYFPYNNLKDMDNKLKLYKSINFNSDYTKFLEKYIQKISRTQIYG